MLFNFATLVPGVLSQNTGGAEIGSVSGFTVNGQRPNSNNMTIDGVANIDTGDNGGNMATTNIDAVAEFKILTNAYQAEYGRAVGGQMQVVTKSGTQQFHGSGYWYGRRSDWDANTWLNNRGRRIPKAKTSRNDSGYTIGGPVFFPGFNEDKKRLFFFWSQEYQRRSNPASRPSDARADRARAAAVTSRRAWTAAATRSRTSATTRRACRAARPTPAAASRTAACSAGFRRTASTQPGLAALNIYPTANFSGGSGLNFTSQDPDSRKRREDLLRMDFQATEQVADHRPLHAQQRRHPAGLRDDLGRQRQRPAPDADAVRPPRLELHALGDRRAEHHDVARVELGPRRRTR